MRPVAASTIAALYASCPSTKISGHVSEAVKIDGVTLTKLDADARGGSAISLAAVIGKPVIFAGTGQAYEDLISFDPATIVNRIVG